jgi:Mrp family chromosome partitioning ATPase/capsular polysaccharide biosynthesis protein
MITAADAPTVRDYARVLWRRRWIVLVVALLAPAAAIAMAERQAPVYQASSDVLLQNSDLASSLTGVASGAPGVSQNPAWLDQTQADLASVPAVAQRAIDLAGAKGITAAELLKKSSITPSSNSDILNFSVSNGNPRLARALATSYAQAYVGYRRHVDTAGIARALAQAKARLARLRSAGDTQSSLYQSVASKVQTLQTLSALQTSNAYVVRTPSRAAKVSPRPTRDGALALALGLILGIGLAFLRETLDTRIRSSDEIGQTLRLPLLGRLPAPPKRLASKWQLATVAEPAGPSAESFRLLRTNLDFANLQRKARTILVTSALEGEGKTTTAANLAVTLARAGRSVVLVDLDLRRPTVQRFFGIDGAPGLTNVVLGELPLDEALRPDIAHAAGVINRNRNGNGNGSQGPLAEGRLEILPAGSLPPDPGEFVEEPAVSRLLAELRERAEYVIVDSPPLLALGDARSLSGRVDGVLLVTRLTMLRRPLLRELARVLDSIPAAKLGFVLGDAHAEERYGYGVQYYGYGSPVEQEATQPVA